MIRVGDKVIFKNDTGGGQVLALRPDGFALILREDGFEELFPLSELVKPQVSYDEMSAHLLHKNLKPIIAEKEGVKAKKKSVTRSRFTEAHEVDLHIEAITDKYRHLSNGEILTIQLDLARRRLEDALMNKKRNLVFIHGVGEGVLRQELQRLISDYPGLKHQDASYRKYGFGATEVFL